MNQPLPGIVCTHSSFRSKTVQLLFFSPGPEQKHDVPGFDSVPRRLELMAEADDAISEVFEPLINVCGTGFGAFSHPLAGLFQGVHRFLRAFIELVTRPFGRPFQCSPGSLECRG